MKQERPQQRRIVKKRTESAAESKTKRKRSDDDSVVLVKATTTKKRGNTTKNTPKMTTISMSRVGSETGIWKELRHELGQRQRRNQLLPSSLVQTALRTALMTDLVKAQIPQFPKHPTTTTIETVAAARTSNHQTQLPTDADDPPTPRRTEPK